jgi:hypothetical protein
MIVVVVDTNVAVTANGRTLPDGVSVSCVAACARRLHSIRQNGLVVLDDGWRILREYKANIAEGGQPGVGDAWLKWLLTNLANPQRCQIVTITPVDAPRMFAEFPSDPALQHFDKSDRKFVAVSRAHPAHPAVLNATDNDWQIHRSALARHGVTVEFLCPDFLDGVEGEPV